MAQPQPQLPLLCLMSWFAERVLPLEQSSTPLFCSNSIMLQVGRLRPGADGPRVGHTGVSGELG